MVAHRDAHFAPALEARPALHRNALVRKGRLVRAGGTGRSSRDNVTARAKRGHGSDIKPALSVIELKVPVTVAQGPGCQNVGDKLLATQRAAELEGCAYLPDHVVVGVKATGLHLCGVREQRG